MPSMTTMENFDTAHTANSDAILTPLGSGGWIPIEFRHTACYVFQKNDLLVILDFGTGINRLISEHDYLLSGIDHVIGFVSHYHADHICGLFYLPAFWGTRHLELYAPGKDIYGKPASEILAGIFTPPSMPRNLADFIPSLEIKDIPMNGMKIGDLDFKFRVQKHGHPSVGIRIGDHVVYCTDTEPEYETIGFAMGANCLLHDAWFQEECPVKDVSPEQVKDVLAKSAQEGHSSNLAVALISREAKVQTAYTIHHNPLISDIAIAQMIKTVDNITTAEMRYAEDGDSINC
jgi:ribonuclease BN (tRNA processing enzyme)